MYRELLELAQCYPPADLLLISNQKQGLLLKVLIIIILLLSKKFNKINSLSSLLNIIIAIKHS